MSDSESGHAPASEAGPGRTHYEFRVPLWRHTDTPGEGLGYTWRLTAYLGHRAVTLQPPYTTSEFSRGQYVTALKEMTAGQISDYCDVQSLTDRPAEIYVVWVLYVPVRWVDDDPDFDPLHLLDQETLDQRPWTEASDPLKVQWHRLWYVTADDRDSLGLAADVRIGLQPGTAERAATPASSGLVEIDTTGVPAPTDFDRRHSPIFAELAHDAQQDPDPDVVVPEQRSAEPVSDGQGGDASQDDRSSDD